VKSKDILNFTHILLTPIPLTRKQKTESSEGSAWWWINMCKGLESTSYFFAGARTHTHTDTMVDYLW